MDGRGGCCIARYLAGAGAGADTYDMSKIDRIMLRFRPIAPKPAAPALVSGGSSSEMSDASPRSGRGKRRSCHGNGAKRCNNGVGTRKRKGCTEEKVDAVVTLPLLPETPDRKEPPVREPLVGLLSPEQSKNVPTWLSFGNGSKDNDRMVAFEGFSAPVDRTVVVPQVKRVVGSCVTVESVTDTWGDVDGLGCMDEERRVNLERDTCPGFISDGFGRVTWTNGAYKKMVGHGSGDVGGETVVWLVMKESVPVTETLASCRAFTCRVRVQYHNMCGNGKERSSITVPCDVWRMDGGGFAWRLDVKAALSLGL